MRVRIVLNAAKSERRPLLEKIDVIFYSFRENFDSGQGILVDNGIFSDFSSLWDQHLVFTCLQVFVIFYDYS